MNKLFRFLLPLRPPSLSLSPLSLSVPFYLLPAIFSLSFSLPCFSSPSLSPRPSIPTLPYSPFFIIPSPSHFFLFSLSSFVSFLPTPFPLSCFSFSPAPFSRLLLPLFRNPFRLLLSPLKNLQASQ